MAPLTHKSVRDDNTPQVQYSADCELLEFGICLTGLAEGLYTATDDQIRHRQSP